MAYQIANYDGLLDDDENVAGTTSTIFIASIFDFDVLNEVPKLGEATTAAAAVQIPAEHTFKPNKGFARLGITQDSGDYNFDDSENFDQTGGTATFKGMVVGSKAEVRGLQRKYRNMKAIVLVKDSNGNYAQIGNSEWQAKISFKYKTGVTPDGKAGADVMIKAFNRCEQLYPFEPQVLA